MPALGRLREHDPRSRAYAFTPRTTATGTVRHRHYGPVLDQGNIGACTGYAMAQWLNTHPAHKARAKYLTGQQALGFYSRATQVDPWPGEYPPTDTGSSGVAVCKAAKEHGWITGYQWIFEGTDQLKAALQTSPVMAGTVWLNDMFTPDHNGYLNVSGSEVGGHEYVIVGWNQRGRYFTMLQSWGKEWGISGYARIPEQGMSYLLGQGGDLVVPTP